MPSRAPQRRRNLASHLRWLRSELAKTVFKYALTSSGARVGMFARACSTSCDRDGAKPCSTFCLCSQANNMCSTMNRVPATRSCQLHSSCGFCFQHDNVLQGRPNIGPFNFSSEFLAFLLIQKLAQRIPTTAGKQNPQRPQSHDHSAQIQRDRHD